MKKKSALFLALVCSLGVLSGCGKESVPQQEVSYNMTFVDETGQDVCCIENTTHKKLMTGRIICCKKIFGKQDMKYCVFEWASTYHRKWLGRCKRHLPMAVQEILEDVRLKKEVKYIHNGKRSKFGHAYGHCGNTNRNARRYDSAK